MAGPAGRPLGSPPCTVQCPHLLCVSGASSPGLWDRGLSLDVAPETQTRWEELARARPRAHSVPNVRLGFQGARNRRRPGVPLSGVWPARTLGAPPSPARGLDEDVAPSELGLGPFWGSVPVCPPECPTDQAASLWRRRRRRCGEQERENPALPQHAGWASSGRPPGRAVRPSHSWRSAVTWGAEPQEGGRLA